jgi:hypothetical protein
VADDMTDADDYLAEKALWPLPLARSDFMLVRLVRLAKAARAEIVDLKARVSALEGK